MTWLAKVIRRLLCWRHRYRQSTSWPDVIVCIRCGYRRAGVVGGLPDERRPG
jgi:hypothetical protein